MKDKLKIIQTQYGYFKKLSFKKKIIAAIILLVLVVFISGMFFPAKPEYTVVKAKKGDIREVVTETGTIASGGRADVFSTSNGIVTELYAANGDQVEKGQELAKVESSSTEQEQQAAYSNYLAAVSSLNASKSSLNTLRSGMYGAWDEYYDLATGDEYENSDGSPKNDRRESAEFNMAKDDWLAAEAKFKDQQTAVAQASAQVSSTWLLYQATQNAVIKAPISGVVSNLSVTDGSAVNIKSATQLKPVLTVSVPGTTEVIVPLSESDVAKVTPGQEVSIDVSAVDNHKYKGVVSRVDSIGNEILGVIRYNAYILVSNADSKLRSGMNADVNITTKKLSNVLSVPNSAVKPYQGGRAVRMPDGKNVKYVPVEIGVKGEERTEILKGIDEGSDVVTSLSNEQLKRPGLFGN